MKIQSVFLTNAAAAQPSIFWAANSLSVLCHVAVMSYPEDRCNSVVFLAGSVLVVL